MLARGLALPAGTAIPDVIHQALSAVPNGRRSMGKRDSMQRKRTWWLPYLVVEFDKNEVAVDALDGSDLANPVWNYRACL